MQQTTDFIDESSELSDLLVTLQPSDWLRVTQFEDWTIEQILTHLYFWNQLADLALTNPESFAEKMQNDILPLIMKNGFRETEDNVISERGSELLSAWQQQFQDMQPRWQSLDPKLRVKWAGPDMSVRSSMTSRQMETWAHGQAIYDVLGLTRKAHDRIENVVRLGVNTFGWSFQTHQRAVPEQLPRLELRLPSGKVLEFGRALGGADINSEDSVIRGEAVEFAQVITQTRNIADTSLEVTGETAREWMSIAQCFAGGKVMPPAAGTRFCVVE